jgi:serine/threonine protein kinase
MGMVYRAHDPTIGRLVALKVLSLAPATAEGAPGAREIFMREARAAGRLSHPNIVTIHDAATDPESQASYIVMEFVPGRTLDAVLQSDEPYTIEEALTIIRQIAQALEYAHRNQVIHRDLKPSNILLTEDNQVKLTDFGIAKILASEGAARTMAIMGTPSYMSPEQVAGGVVDARSDLFSLGILMYLLLTGKKPFGGDTAAVMFKIVYEDPIPPTAVNLQLHPELDYIVLRCLAKDRNKRYGSAREILADLDDFQHGQQPRSKTRLPLYAPPQAEPTLTQPIPTSPIMPWPGSSRSKKRWMAAGATAALVIALVLAADLGVGAYRLWTAQPPPPTGISKAPPRVPSGLRGWPRESTSGYSPLPALEDGLPVVSPEQTTPEAVVGYSEGTTHSRQAKKPPVKPEAAPQTSAELASAATTAPATPPPQRPLPEVVTPRVVQLFCEHGLKEGSITVSSGAQLIFEGKLRGRKKGGFLGIKGGHIGTYLHPINLPPDTHQLSVRVISSDGSVDLTGTIAAGPPPGASPTLRIVVAPRQLKLDWQAGARPTQD